MLHVQMCVVTLYVAIKPVLTLLPLGIYAGGGGIIISTLGPGPQRQEL